MEPVTNPPPKTPPPPPAFCHALMAQSWLKAMSTKQKTSALQHIASKPEYTRGGGAQYLQKVPLQLEDLPAQLVHLVARAAGDGQVAYQVAALEFEGADVHQAHAVSSLALRRFA